MYSNQVPMMNNRADSNLFTYAGGKYIASSSLGRRPKPKTHKTRARKHLVISLNKREGTEDYGIKLRYI